MGNLISDDYRALNRQMHAVKSSYGANGHRWAIKASDLIIEYDCKSILDYGCGKGALARNIIGSIDIQEYDPAIKGKDAGPRPSDLVVCTDVLEHVEASRIVDVLEHLARLTQKIALFSISIIPANKHLPDGRNAHILIRIPDWWKEQLGRWFDLKEWSASTTNVTCIAVSKFREIGKVETIAAVDDDIRNEQARLNCAIVSERLQDHVAHDNKAILVCFGPSLKQTWPSIALAQANGAGVVTVSGAHKFLIDRRVIPDFHTDCDPREHKARQFGEPHRDVRYWLASCVHPSYVERLRGFDLSLWHLWNGDSSAAIWDYEPEAWMVQGASNAGLRALSLLYALGYRDVEIHGMDCSSDGGHVHAGAHLGKKQDAIRVKCRDRWFTTTPLLAVYARQFDESLPMYPGMKIGLAGDGLLQHMTKGA